MSETSKPRDDAEASGNPTQRYEKPAIVWEEEYKPTAFGVSCAKQPGNPSCASGPVVA